jgi:transcriptional regulator with XRE-family HTH domain
MNDFTLESSRDIAKEIGKRAKVMRKQTDKTQKEFADFVGIPFGTYARFEKTGQLQLPDFILVMQRLDRAEELQAILIPTREIKW